MSDTFHPQAASAFDRLSAGSAPRPPFAVSDQLRAIDEQLTQMILRASNVRDRLLGTSPQAPQATNASPSNARDLCEHIEDKLRVLNNLVAALDTAI